MLRTLCSGLILILAEALSAQDSAKVDFRRDVQPIFREHCIGCHGPSQQMGGLRLDRRRDAMRGGTVADIGPRNSAASRLYLRLIGNEYGAQMPLTGALNPEQIGIIKAWIDEGAEWPDDVSGDTASLSSDPKATRMMEALRDGNRQAVRKMLRDDPKIAGLKGRGGAAPLMYAALYGDADSVRALLENGADPNIKNDAGATALMWAVDDLEKTRLLLDHGADVNARSDDESHSLAHCSRVVRGRRRREAAARSRSESVCCRCTSVYCVSRSCMGSRRSRVSVAGRAWRRCEERRTTRAWAGLADEVCPLRGHVG